MARFRHTVTLTPVPRAWFEQAVALGWDALSEHLGSELLPLVGGEPLAPGAHYASADTVVTLDAWHRNAESSGRITTSDTDMTTTCHVRLHSAAAPRALQVEGGAGDGRRLTTGTGGFTVDFERWWSGRGTAVLGRFDHAMARGTFEVARGAGDPWVVDVTVTVRGRGLFRPLVAPVLAIARGRFRREFAAGLDRFAARWDEEVPKFLAMPPEQLRELIATEPRETEPH